MSNEKANAAYHGRTERPSFPEDALTADERKTLARLDAEERREGWGGAASEWASVPKPARFHVSTEAQRYLDGPPVKATWGNLAAMFAGAAVIIAIVGGIYLEFAALAH